MVVLLSILGYCLVVWIVMLIMGWLDENNTWGTDLVFTAGLLWPLFLVVVFVVGTLEGLITLGVRFPLVGKVFHCIGMLFRPYSLGQDIYTFVKRKGKTTDDDD